MSLSNSCLKFSRTILESKIHGHFAFLNWVPTTFFIRSLLVITESLSLNSLLTYKLAYMRLYFVWRNSLDAWTYSLDQYNPRLLLQVILLSVDNVFFRLPFKCCVSFVSVVVRDLNYKFDCIFSSVSNTSWNCLGKTSEKKHMSCVALMSLLLLMGTELSPLFSPSMPIRWSMKSTALTYFEPWHIMSAKIFKAKRSMNILSDYAIWLSLLSNYSWFDFWGETLNCLGWCLMSWQSGPVWI